MHTRRRKSQLVAEINVVPYIDVMLVLLIIFMITAPLLTQGVEVDLPQTKVADLIAQDADQPIVFTVNQTGDYFWEPAAGKPQQIAAEDLSARASNLIAQYPKAPVLVKGDQAVPYARVMQLMVLLQQAGATQVGLVTEPLASQ